MHEEKILGNTPKTLIATFSHENEAIGVLGVFPKILYSCIGPITLNGLIKAYIAFL